MGFLEWSTSFSITPEHYTSSLEGNDSVRIYACALNEDNGEFATGFDIIHIRSPVIHFADAPSHAITDQEVKITVAFENPLDIPLTGCEAHFGGSLVKETVWDHNLRSVSNLRTHVSNLPTHLSDLPTHVSNLPTHVSNLLTYTYLISETLEL